MTGPRRQDPARWDPETVLIWVGLGLALLVRVGTSVSTGDPVWMNWESTGIILAGPRVMKSSAITIPRVLDAPGACLVTENKRGVLDATRELRNQKGHVWVLDPQQVANEPQTWWWDPLSYVTDESRTERLAAQFMASTTIAGAKRDAHFDSAGERLIYLFVLAAATAGQPITQVYSWLSAPSNEDPQDILREAGYQLQYEALADFASHPDRQQAGEYGTAIERMGFLLNSKMRSWITPPSTGGIHHFNPETFVRSTDTLYALSKDGKGSAGPINSALTMAVLDAAEEYATTCPGGRLPVPLCPVLDEIANVCRLTELDSKYSHYGSRGIPIWSVLQSWAQGEEVWGDKGMEKLRNAANVKVYGGGVDDDRFLRRLSDLIGSYNEILGSTSTGRTGRSRSYNVSQRPVFSISELRDLPPGQAIAFASGVPAILLKTEPWFESPHADQISASIRKHEPTGSSTAELTPAATGASTNPWVTTS